MSKILRPAIAMAFIAVCFAAGVWGIDAFFAQGRTQPSSDSEQGAIRVGVTQPRIDELADRFTMVGTISPIRSIELRPLAAGRLVEIAAESAATVESGDLIFRLDDRSARASVADARATLDETRSAFERFEQLAAENIAAAARLEEARAAFRRARAAVELAEAELEDRTLIAPFAGQLGIIDIDPGEYVDPSSVVSTLDDLSVVEAEVALPEKYFHRTSVGQRVRLESAAHPNQAFEGKVSVKSPRIDVASRRFDLRVRVANSERHLTSGMFVRAELIFDSYTAPTLPDDAIINEGDATYVYTVTDGIARRTDIEVRDTEGGRTEVASGVGPDDHVVVTGWDTLSDGAPVEIAEAAPPDEALN